MSLIIQAIEAEQMQGKNIPKFSAGDIVEVKVRVKESTKEGAVKGAAKIAIKSASKETIRERVQAYEGVVIAKRNRGLNSSFTVRKISHGEGVERVFQTYSPAIEAIEVKRRGSVRKAKLYYLRELSGKAARIKEKIPSKKSADVIKAMGSNEVQEIDIVSE